MFFISVAAISQVDLLHSMCISFKKTRQKRQTTSSRSRVQCPNRPNGWEDVFAGWTQSKFRGPRWETYTDGRVLLDGSTVRNPGINSPVEVGSLSFYPIIYQGFSTIQTMVGLGIFEPSTVSNKYHMIFRVSAPSKRWLALGFLKHQRCMIHNRTMSVARCKTGHYIPQDKEGTQHTLPWRSVDVANQAKAKWRQWHSTNARRGRHDHESSMNQRWRSKSHVNGGEFPLTLNQMCQCRFGLYSTAGQNCFNNFASRSGAMSTLRHEGHGRWIQGHHDATGVEDP